jgi:hypothetical protein
MICSVAQPLTLIESKRQTRGTQDLQQAARQAKRYARALLPPAFAVAALRGMWSYRRDGAHAVYMQHVTSLELHQTPERGQRLFMQRWFEDPLATSGR